MLGIISNFDERLHSIVKNLSLAEYFTFIITSRECGYEVKKNIAQFTLI